MEILLWLVPSLVVLVVAMAWVTWLGRDGRGEVERDVEQLARALAREPRTRRRGPSSTARTPTPRDRSTGIAVRPTRRGAVDPTRRAS